MKTKPIFTFINRLIDTSKWNVITIFIGTLIVLIVALPLKTFWQVHWYPMHDTTHFARLFLMEKTIRAGQFPPIWADLANETYGYPLFHFYAPFLYYLTLPLKLLVSSYSLGFKLALSLLTFIGGLGMYFLGRRWGRVGGLLAAASFLTLPYNAVNLFVRGAFAEYTATMLLPWLFLVWQKPQRGKQVYLTSLITSVFVLSHNLVPLIVFPILVVWILYHHHHSLKSLVYPAILFLLLTSYFLLPLLFERSFVQVDRIARTTDFHLHFVQPWQLWNSTWGFGGSAPGVEDGMSFKLGKLQILLAGLGLLYLLKSKKFRAFGLILSFSIAFAFFMTTQFSQPIWQFIPYLSVIQFPWRYLTLLGFLVAFLSGIALQWWPRLLRLPVVLIFVLTLFFFNLKYFRPQSNFPSADQDLVSQTYLTHTLAWIIPEYLPAWMPSFPSQPPTSFIQNQLPEYQLISQTNRYQLMLSLKKDQTIIINKTYYPTWKATLDNKTITLIPTKDGLIQTFIPRGQHTLILFQSHTLLEQLSFYLSLATIIYIIIKLTTKY